jgi:hypothetical protein
MSLRLSDNNNNNNIIIIIITWGIEKAFVNKITGRANVTGDESKQEAPFPVRHIILSDQTV